MCVCAYVCAWIPDDDLKVENEDNLKVEYDVINEDNPKNEGDLENEEDLENEDDLKIRTT